MIVAPMFHAWGFSQLVLRRVDGLHGGHPAQIRSRGHPGPRRPPPGDRLAVVPVMFDRIMDLPAEVRNRYSGRSLRFAAASGSRMRPDVVTAFMDQFGDMIYNNYNATEAGMIATATPKDLRAAPTPPAGPRAEPKSASWTPNSTNCRPARWAASACATTASSTDTPRATPRTSTTDSCRQGMSATSMMQGVCSWSVATTR